MHIGLASIESPWEEGVGGIAAYLRALIPELVNFGHRVTLFARAQHRAEFEAYDGRVKVRHIVLPNLHWYMAKLPLLGKAFSLPLREIEWSRCFYDEVSKLHCIDPMDVIESVDVGGLYLPKLAPCMIRMNGMQFLFDRFMQQKSSIGTRLNFLLTKEIFRNAHRVSSPGKFMADQIAETLGWQSGRIRVIANPINAELLKYCKQETPNERDENLILYTGRLAKVKGTIALLAAFRLAQQQNPKLKCVLAGAWQLPGNPRDYGLEDAGVWHDGLCWAGYLPWDDLLTWYRKAAIFVMPSYFEAFGISVVEAMALGLPVVASRVGGLCEIIEDGVDGLLIQAGDVEALGKSLLMLAANPELRQKMGEHGSSKVIERYHPMKIAQQTQDLYQEMIKNV